VHHQRETRCQYYSGNKVEVVVKLAQCCVQRLRIRALPVMAQELNFFFPFKQFKAHADFMDPVVDLLKLGGFIHDNFRGGDLPAIMQPAGGM
jgi:hypothetical protein